MRALTATLGAILLVPSALASELHVPADYATIGAALAAAQPGDSVLVSAGTFAPSTNGESFPLFLSTAGVSLIGAGAGLSILDAEGTATVVECDGGARVAHFTVTGGHGDWGGGIDVSVGAPELDQLWIVQNGALRRGSGINVQGAAAPYIHHNVIWSNFDTDLTHGGDPHGIQLAGTSLARVEHNLIGMGDSNGLITQESAAPQIRNNIFLRNGIAALRGRGICHFGSPATVIAYNLFHENMLAALVLGSGVGNVSAAMANEVSPSDEVYGNLDGDPLLADTASENFALLAGSPAIDAGDPTSALDPDGTRADVGPYFFDSVTAVPPFEPGLRLLRYGPNPTTGSVRLELEALRAGSVEIAVHDVRGRLVAKQVQRISAGEASLLWEGRDLPRGLYLLRIRNGLSEIRIPLIVQR